MDQNPVFQWIWRLNALVILAAGLGTLGLAVLALGSELIRELRPHGVPVPTEAAPAPAPERLVVGALSPVPGTALLHAPVQASDLTLRLSGYKSGVPARNVVFFDTRDGRSRRLLPDHRGVVDGLEFLPAGADRDGTRRPATALLFVARRADRNGDGVIDGEDAGELMGAPVEGGAPAVLAEDVRALRGAFDGPTGAAQAFFETAAGVRFVEFDPRTLAVSRTGAVEP